MDPPRPCAMGRNGTPVRKRRDGSREASSSVTVRISVGDELLYSPSRPKRDTPPVDAAVTDPFRRPATPYGPGNRGLEYATAPGTPARAIGAGTVTFAGRVAGRGVVTVQHPDGLRSSLTGLAEVRVAVGDRVGRGDVLGTAAAMLHLGVRRGDEYVDPAALFADGPPRHVVLVPVPE